MLCLCFYNSFSYYQKSIFIKRSRNMEIDYQLTEEQTKLKKKWLNWMLFNELWMFLCVVTHPLFVAKETPLNHDRYVAIFFGALLGGLLKIVILYIRAYKKHGTLLLTLFMVISPLIFVKNVIQSFNNGIWNSHWALLLFLVDVTIFAILYRYSFLLRKLNIQIITGFFIKQEPIYQLTEEQRKQKRNWLSWTVFRCVWTVVNMCVFPFVLPTNMLIGKNEYVAVLAGTVIGSLIFLASVYMCAYRKPGTRLLQVLLIVSPIQFVNNVIQTLFGRTFSSNGDIWILVITLSEIGFFLWWYWLTSKLKTLNYQIKKMHSDESRIIINDKESIQT